MADEETKVESQQDETEDELIRLKKEMAGRIVDKMKEKDQNDIILTFWKDLIVDYLVDEWNKDSVNDFLIWMGLDLWISMNLFDNSLDKLSDLRKEIKNKQTKEELDSLEESIINNLDTSTDWNQHTSSQWSSYTTSAATGTVTSWLSSSPYNNPTTDDNYTPDIEVSVDSASIWEAKEVPLNQRMSRLFPEWVPSTEREMKKYMTKIKVPIRTPEWKKKKLTLHIHKKLANEYKAIFQEMFDRWIPVNPASTWWFNFRKMRKWNKLSHHSYWTAVDVNWDVNGWVYGATVPSSPYYNDQATIDIRKKHWFYRWWDWSRRNNDPMHFTYMNG